MFFDGDKVRAKGPGQHSYELNLGAIYQLEARRAEIHGVGLMGARELLKAMQDGIKAAGEALVILDGRRPRCQSLCDAFRHAACRGTLTPHGD